MLGASGSSVAAGAERFGDRGRVRAPTDDARVMGGACHRRLVLASGPHPRDEFAGLAAGRSGVEETPSLLGRHVLAAAGGDERVFAGEVDHPELSQVCDEPRRRAARVSGALMAAYIATHEAEVRHEVEVTQPHSPQPPGLGQFERRLSALVSSSGA